MKIFVRCLLFFPLLLNSCSNEKQENGLIDPPGMLRNSNGDVIKVSDSDCEDLANNLPQDVFGFVSEKIDLFFYEEARKLLKSSIPKYFDFKEIETNKTLEYAKRKILEFKVFYSNIPLCEGYAKIYQSSEKIFLTGNLPPIDIKEPLQLNIPEEINQEALEKKFETTDLKQLNEKSLCYALKNHELIPVWKQKFEREKAPYEVLGYAENIISIEPLFFHAVGTAKIYEEKDTDDTNFSALKNYTLAGLSSGGTLCSERFRVAPEDGQVIAYNKDLSFIFNPTSELEKFEQAALFTYAEEQANYIKSLVHTKKWYGPQILIYPDTQNEGLTNNVFYLPGDEENLPAIQVPKGDNKKLHQVRLDNEAIQHEVGHHVFYRSVKTGNGESGILHEAVADIFVMLRTKNGCLGEHLCLNDSLCVSLSCLRTAENDLTSTSYLDVSGKHKQSQLISGMLWDVALKIGYDNTAAWLNYSIDLMPENADFSDFVVALFNSLDELYKEKDVNTFKTNCQHFMDALEKRELIYIKEENNLSCDA